jgi:hypothetical protein
VWLNNDVVLRLQVDDSPEPLKAATAVDSPPCNAPTAPLKKLLVRLQPLV